jgi:hypothetical protein
MNERPGDLAGAKGSFASGLSEEPLRSQPARRRTVMSNGLRVRMAASVPRVVTGRTDGEQSCL